MKKINEEQKMERIIILKTDMYAYCTVRSGQKCYGSIECMSNIYLLKCEMKSLRFFKLIAVFENG